MKKVAFVGIFVFVLVCSAWAQIVIRQVASFTGPNESCSFDYSTSTWVCTPIAANTFVPVTVNFNPTLGGNVIGFVGLPGQPPCVDNLGQQWTATILSSDPQTVAWTSPPNTGQFSGLTSLTCYIGAPSGSSIQFLEISGVIPTPAFVGQIFNGGASTCGTINPNSVGVFLLNFGAAASTQGSDPGAPSPETITSNLTQAMSSAEYQYMYGADPGGLPNYGELVTQQAMFYAITGAQPLASSVTANNPNPAPFYSLPIWCQAVQFAAAPDLSPDIGSSSPSSGCDGTCGLPINLRSGNTWIEQHDYAVPGLGGGITVTRTWNSMFSSTSPPNPVGMFGNSWTSTYEEAISVVIDSQAKYWRADGSAWTLTWNPTSQTYTVTSPSDEHATLTFNSTAQLYTLSFPDGSLKVFNSTGQLQSLSDRNGNQTVLTHDAQSRLTNVTTAGGQALTFNYGNANSPYQVSSIQDTLGVVATYTYGAAGTLSSVTYADNSILNFTHDSNQLLLSVTDGNGKLVEANTYDPIRRGLTSQRAGGVDLVTANYNTSGAQISDTNGNLTNYGVTYAGNRRLVSSITGPGCDSCIGRGNWSYTYDGSGNRTQAIDPLGHFTNFGYDANGNMTSKQIQIDTANDTQNWSYTYNSFNEVLTATDPLGNQTTNTYDAKGNLLTTTTPPPASKGSGSKTSFTYDTKGDLTQITDPLKNSTTLTYYTTGLVQTIKDTQGNTTSFQYDARGNRTSVTDANNQQTTFTYDLMNRLTKITYPTSPVTYTQFGYDYRGRKISSTDPNGKVTQYAYDDADRLMSVTDTNTGRTQYGYDNESNLTSIIDASGNKTSFQYDAYGHVTETVFPSTYFETYSYDSNGNVLSKEDRNNNVVNYTYDYLNRLTTKQGITTANYTYDLANHLTQVTDPTGTYVFTYDGMGRLTQTSTTYSFISGKTFTVGFGYDASSNRTSMSDPQNASTSYAYDTLNRLMTLTYPSRTNYTFAYDALNRRTQLTRPNSVTTTYQYDTLSRLLGVFHKKSTTVLDGATYAYDAVGNRTSRTDNRTNVTSTYDYDPLYELTQVLQGTTTAESYSYDPVGNRLSSLNASSYTYNASNELTSKPGVSYTYDNNGNMLTKADSTGTTSYSWDFQNRLTSLTLPGSGGTVTFKYDPFGRRVQKTSSSATTNYLYDGANVLEEVDGSGNVLARYVQSPGIDQPLSETRASTTSYYQADGLGSITSLSNSSAALANTYTYDAFGNLTASTGTVTNPLRYTGREFDSETGIYYYRARYFDPVTGRFLNEDQIGWRGGDVNLYRYVGNEPTVFVDPSGKDIAVIENGPTQGNPIGHTAIAITDAGVYSFGNSTPPGSSLAAYLLREAPRRNTDVYVLKTTPEQDRAALAYLKSLGDTRVKLPLLGGNCSNISNGALHAAGIPSLPLIWGGDPHPGIIPEDLPGTAGDRAELNGAKHFSMPLNSQNVPSGLSQFEPKIP